MQAEISCIKHAITKFYDSSPNVLSAAYYFFPVDKPNGILLILHHQIACPDQFFQV